MQKALYFEDAAEFCDFVRLFGGPAKPPRDRGNFELCRVVNPEEPGGSALVLFNFRAGMKGLLRGPGTPIQAEIDADGRKLRWNLADGGEIPVLERSLGKTLLEFVEIQPWRNDRGRFPKGPVLFWIENNDNSQSSDLLSRLVQDSLRLGNDRIQFGTLEAEGRNATLLRIEKPSFFLVQRCLEEFAGQVDLFYPVDTDLFVRWGHAHPMADWWRQSEKVRSNSWLFFRGGTDYQHVNPVAWRDAYDLAEIALDFPHRESWTASAATPPHFEVPLTLERRLSEVEPELWLLDEAGVRQLEKTLQITDQESLRAWQIAVRLPNDDDPENSQEPGSPPEWVFLRETLTGSKRRRHHDFAGTGFARYRGLNNLFLPVGCELQPPLRRDAYRTLFDLQPDTLTLLNPDAAPGAFTILRIPEKAFDTLSSFVDYIVERDATRLKSLMAGSVFDFRHYLKAPSRPDLVAGKRGESVAEGGKPVLDLDTSPPQPAEPAEAESAPEPIALPERPEEPQGIDESKLDAWHREELRIERELLAEGQSLDRWCELLVCKNELGKNADAILCAIEAYWLSSGTGHEEALWASLASFAKATLAPDQDPASISAGESEWLRRAAVFSLVTGRPRGREKLDRWVGEATAFLSEHEAGLRSKERWLAWGAVLSANRDLRRETRIREEIRNAITESGLSLEETPAFLRSRLFLDRQTGPSESESGTGGAETAVANLGEMREAGMNFKTTRLAMTARAILARAYGQLGDSARAEGMLESTSMSDVRKDPCAHAWEGLFQIEALRKTDLSRAETLDRQFEGRLEKADVQTVTAIREMRETYRKREDADNPAAFLAQQNRARTYPSGDATESGILYELSMQLEARAAEGNEAGAVQVMRQMMTLPDRAEYADPVKLPQFVETLVAGLERFKWGERGAGLIPVFESFSDRAPGYLAGNPDPFYLAILQSNLALGLLSIESLEKAASQLESGIEAVSQIETELDFRLPDDDRLP